MEYEWLYSLVLVEQEQMHMELRPFLKRWLLPLVLILRELELVQEVQISSCEWRCCAWFSMNDIWHTKNA